MSRGHHEPKTSESGIHYAGLPYNLWVTEQYRDYGQGPVPTLLALSGPHRYPDARPVEIASGGYNAATKLRDAIVDIIERHFSGAGAKQYAMIEINRIFEDAERPDADDGWGPARHRLSEARRLVRELEQVLGDEVAGA